jgi:hypothetical protein
VQTPGFSPLAKKNSTAKKYYNIYMFVGSLRSINASIYFFVDVRQWFAAQISAAGVEQAPAPAK